VPRLHIFATVILFFVFAVDYCKVTNKISILIERHLQYLRSIIITFLYNQNMDTADSHLTLDMTSEISI